MIKNFLITNMMVLPIMAKTKANGWQPVLDLLINFLDQTKTFLQAITIGVVVVMAIYYKMREIAANAQEEQQFSQKTRNVLIGCAFIFLIPTLASVLETFFRK